MTNLRRLCAVWAVCLLSVAIGQAQTDGFAIAYDETRSALFDSAPFVHQWTFTGQARDIIALEVYRIAGQFTPRARLLAGDGSPIASEQTDPFTDSATLNFADGLPEDGTYVIEVRGLDVNVNQADNPAEYSLTLRRDGQRKASVDEGLTPLPEVGRTPPPDLLVGEPVPVEALDVVRYGNAVRVSEIDTGTAEDFFLLENADFRLTVNDTRRIAEGVSALAFRDDGVGFVAQHGNLPEAAVFFSDQNFELAYDRVQRLYTLTLADGRVILTDFFRLRSLEVRDGVVAARAVEDGELKRLIFDGNRVALRQVTGRSQTQEQLNSIRLEDGEFIITDLEGFDTLAHLGGQLRVLYGADARFISDAVRLEQLRQNNERPAQTDVVIAAGGTQPAPLTLTIDWTRFGDVHIAGDELRVIPLSNRQSVEPLAALEAVLLEAQAVRYARADGSFRTVLPDGTDIETPASRPANPDALPHEANFAAANFNNLGERPLPLCPCVDGTREVTPVNPANGNFFYPVTDFAIPSHTLQLDFTRYYNAQDVGSTPAYMLAAPQGYLPGQLGDGWRHSYQYELDISGAPLGTVRLILPDGTRHDFERTDAPTLYRSTTLLAWQIERLDGVLGRWQATRTDGVTYHFDRAGRLARISETPQRAITLSPMPGDAPYAGFGAGGFIVTEPYGRRLELHTNAAGRLSLARDHVGRQIAYAYTGSALTGVDYGAPEQTATYAYGVALTRIADVRSPYHPHIDITYDARRRVQRYVENPDDALTRNFRYSYEESQSERATTQEIIVDGALRRTTWRLTPRYQLVGFVLPGEAFAYEYSYNSVTGRLDSIRQPTLNRYRYDFDERGNLIALTDPLNTFERYEWTYVARGAASLLTEMAYPNGRVDTFQWSEGAFPQLIASTQQIGTQNREAIVRTTRYVYDDWGRLAMRVAPGGIATVYQYDDFGYPTAIWEGIELAAGETLADVERDRARRIVRYDFDSLGQIRAITDGRNHTYTLNWNNTTRRLRTLNGPTGVSMAYAYDALGRVIEVRDRGQVIAYRYDGLGNVIEEARRAADAGGTDAVIRTRYTYDEAGNLRSLTDNLGQVTTFAYDALDNLTRVVAPDERITTYRTFLDPDGDFLWREATDPRGRVFTQRYDSLGRLNRFVLQEGEFSQQFDVEYNATNLPTRIAERSTTRSLDLTYNLAGEVLSVEIDDALLQLTYDERGLLASATTPAGRTYAYAHDPLGNLSAITLPDGTRQQMIYDESDNLVSAVDANGLVTTYLYDALNRLTDVENAAGERTSYEYDLRGNRISHTDPRDVVRRATYDVFDRLIQTTDGRGDVTTYAYDGLSRVVDIDAPGSPGRRFTYDARGNIITVTQRPQEQRTLYSYDAVNRLTSITDALANTTTFNYSALNRISTIVDAVGNTQRYRYRQGTLYLGSYEAPTVAAAVDDAINFTTDSLGRVTFIEDRRPEQSRALDTAIDYDPDGYLLRVQTGTDTARAAGDGDVRYQFAYDPNGRLVGYVDAADRAWALVYDAGGRMIEATDAAGRVWRYTYDDAGRITRVERLAPTEAGTLAAYAVEQYAYDGAGNIIGYTAPDGVEHAYAYHPNNQLAQATLAVGTPVEAIYQFEYDSQGELARMVDPLGNQTRYFYTLGGRLARVERDLEADVTLATSYEYDDTGNLRAITLPSLPGSTAAPTRISLAYNALNQRVRYVNGANNVWSYTYDAAGNVAQISDPLGSILQYEYDVYHNVTAITYPTGAQVELAYDERRALRSVTLPPNSDDREQTLTYTLDAAGNVIAIEDEDAITRYEYDVLGNVIRRTLPDGSITTYDYDGAGRLMRTHYDDGSIIEREYDPAGRLLRAGSLTYTYDALGRLQQATDFATLRYTYDALGHVLARESDVFGTTTYAYDALYRPVRVALDGVGANISYNGRGLPREILRDNGVRTVFNYDPADRPVSILQFGEDNARLDGFNYQYNDVGNLIRVDRITDGSRTLYSYDVAHRLIEERWLNANGETIYTVSFRYDEVGNRVEETRNGSRTQFVYNAQNQLVGEIRNLPDQNDDLVWVPVGLLLVGAGWQWRRRRWGWLLACAALLPLGGVYAAVPPFQPNAASAVDVRYTYDANGNLAQVDYQVLDDAGAAITRTLVLTYDPEQRLIAVAGTDAQGNAVNTNLGYDSFSRLSEWRTGPTNAYRVSWDGSQVLGIENEVDPGDAPRAFVFAHDAPLLSVQGDAGALWHLNDQLGSTRLYADRAGALVESPDRQLNFGSFGERIFPYTDSLAPAGADVETLALFANGQLYDPSTDLYLIGLRAYDPRTALFLQPDPVRQDPFSTLYAYARQRPFAFNDAFGLFVEALLDPTQITDVPQAFRPQALLPQFDMPDIPEPPRIPQRQHDEFFRLLALVDTIDNGTNERVVQVAPHLDDLHLITANPLPAAQRDRLAQPGRTRLDRFEGGWSPDLSPHSTPVAEPFSIIDTVAPVLNGAMLRPLAWCVDSGNPLRRTITEVLPAHPAPLPIPPQWQAEAALPRQLQPVPVFEALVPTLNDLTALAVRLPDPALPDATVALPDPSVEPPVLNNLDQLRETTFDLLRPILPPDLTACADCVRPLSFSP